MGLFDWFTGKKNKVEIANDRIWLSQEAKNAGIRKEVAQAIANPVGPKAIIVVAHFNDRLEQLQTAMAELDQDRVLVTCADALTGRTPTDLVTDESGNILIVVGERHLLSSHDKVILNFARSQPCRCHISYHLSLEDPLMKRFSGEWVERILRGLGMKEDEAIESRMVARRIQAEQEKIARSAKSDLPAESAEEWLKRNCPEIT